MPLEPTRPTSPGPLQGLHVLDDRKWRWRLDGDIGRVGYDVGDRSR